MELELELHLAFLLRYDGMLSISATLTTGDDVMGFESTGIFCSQRGRKKTNEGQKWI